MEREWRSKNTFPFSRMASTATLSLGPNQENEVQLLPPKEEKTLDNFMKLGKYCWLILLFSEFMLLSGAGNTLYMLYAGQFSSHSNSVNGCNRFQVQFQSKSVVKVRMFSSKIYVILPMISIILPIAQSLPNTIFTQLMLMWGRKISSICQLSFLFFPVWSFLWRRRMGENQYFCADGRCFDWICYVGSGCR